MPQLPKNQSKLDQVEIDLLVAKAVHMLTEYAKQNLSDADALLSKTFDSLTETEIEHPDNVENVDSIRPVLLNTAQLKSEIDRVKQAIGFVAEALDIPDMALHSGRTAANVDCKNCGHITSVYVERADKSEVREFLVRLITTYLERRQDVDEFIKFARAKWKVDRMVTIDRDILRLACTEAFFFDDVPVNVSISEAVELCHRFADEKAAKFINGVLSDLSGEAKQYRLKGKFGERVLENEQNQAQDQNQDGSADNLSVERETTGV